MSAARDPRRALLAVVAALGLLLTAGLLPAFGGAAPAGDLAREISRAAGPVSAEVPGGSLPGGSGLDGPNVGDAGGLGGLGGLDSPFSLGGGGLLVGDGGGGGDSGAGGGGGSGGQGDSPGDSAAESRGSPGGGGLLEALFRLFGGGGGGGGGDPGGGTPRADGGDGGSAHCQRTDGYRVCLPAASLTPGRSVVVQVRRDGEPAADVPVRVDGEFVGRTGHDGTVPMMVPYAAEFRVAVGRPSAAVAPRDDRAYSLAGADGGVTVPVRTDVSVAVETTDPDPGGRAVVRATVGQDPAPGMAVFVGGERAGTTGPDGRATVRLPTATETAVRVERGDVAAERTVALFEPTARAKGLVALPGTTVDVVVTEGSRPLADATVAVGGETYRTDENGTASVALPAAPTADVTVGAHGVTATLTKRLWLFPAGAALVGLAGLVAAGLLYRRAEGTGRSMVAQAAATLAAAASATLSWLVALAANAEDAARAAADSLREFAASFEAPDLDPAAVLRGQVAALVAFLDPRPRLAGLRDRFGDDEAATADATTGENDSRHVLEATWATFVRRVGVSRPSRRTPGEVAEAALAGGFPRRPVERLTEAFRAVEYADDDPDRHAETAARAAEELEVDG